MSYLVLARKYRPQTFEEVISQSHITQTLTNAISMDRVAHAILFSGPRGTGKTTVARILAKAMNCKQGPTSVPCNVCRSCEEITSGSAVDVFEIDGASNNSVDQVRELRENIKYMPAHSPYKIYIIDEVHMLSIAAFNALLKSLEEPPAHIIFIFATTEPHKIPITILSRCQRHDFRRIGTESIVKHLLKICGHESVDITAESLWLLAREAGGSMRDALSLLDQIMAFGEGAITYEQVLDVLGIIDRKIIFDISEAVLQKDSYLLLNILDEVYQRGHDIRKLYADLLEHFRNMLVVKMGKGSNKLVDLPGHESDRIQALIKEVSPALLKQIFDLFFKEEAAIRFASQPKLALEMAFIKICEIMPALPIDVLIEKLDVLKKEISVISTNSDVNDQNRCTVNEEKKTKTKIDEFLSVADPRTSFGGATPGEDRDLETAWKRIRETLSESSPSLATSLANSSLKKVADQRLEIEVNGNGFNINMIKRKRNIATLKRAIKEFFGNKIDFVINAKLIQNDHNQEKKGQETRLKQEALSHPLVAEVIEIFDGTVVEVKVL